MKISRPTKVTIATMLPLSGSRTNPKSMLFPAIVIQVKSKVAGASSSRDKAKARNEGIMAAPMPAMEIKEAAKPQRQREDKTQATKGNTGIKPSQAKVSTVSVSTSAFQ